MSLTKQDISALFRGAEAAGDSCLQLCQLLNSHGVNLAMGSAKLGQISSELQRLLYPQSAMVEKSILVGKSDAQQFERNALVKSCVLDLNDPRIAEINSLRMLQDLQ